MPSSGYQQHRQWRFSVRRRRRALTMTPLLSGSFRSMEASPWPAPISSTVRGHDMAQDLRRSRQCTRRQWQIHYPRLLAAGLAANHHRDSSRFIGVSPFAGGSFDGANTRLKAESRRPSTRSRREIYPTSQPFRRPTSCRPAIAIS